MGARLRPTTELDGARIGTQIVTALGVGVDILPRELLSATLEGWALPNLAEQHDVSVSSFSRVSTPNGKYIAPAEWQLSARTAPLHSRRFVGPARRGRRLAHHQRSADDAELPLHPRRALGARRPTRRASSRGARRRGGAPTHASVDLHLAGAKDVCTSEPDLVDGFKDNDGCPDEDQDKDGIPDRLDQCPHGARGLRRPRPRAVPRSSPLPSPRRATRGRP